MSRKRHRRHANPFTLRTPPPVPAWPTIFARQAPLALDIGCGSGLFVAACANQFPHLNVLGLEIRPHLVASAAQRLQTLPNAHVLLANANLHLAALLHGQQVAQVSLNFPDPWYKKRHHKRRVLNTSLLAALQTYLLPHAALHIMTDYAPLALAIRAVLQAAPAWRCMHAPLPFAPHSTTGLTSEREITHAARGEPIYRLHFSFDAAAKAATLEQQCS